MRYTSLAVLCVVMPVMLATPVPLDQLEDRSDAPKLLSRSDTSTNTQAEGEE